jgi:predicted peptidase
MIDPLISQNEGELLMHQQAKILQKDITLTVTLPYLLYLPKDYDPQKRWPLVLFLHGSGQRGTDLTSVTKHGLPKLVEEGQDFPFILVSPQCPKRSGWYVQTPALNVLLDEIEGSYAVDPDRIYVTGLSMGGYGTWGLAVSNPQRFAALMPICGAGDPEEISVIKHVPTWVFHGDKDDVVPLAEVEATVNALKACGGNVKFTVYPGVGHNSWTQTYNNPEVYTWLLSHHK